MATYWTTLALLILVGVSLVLIPHRWLPLPGIAAVMCSVAWQKIDQRREGHILWTFDPSHGLTEADLAVPIIVGLALVIRIALRRNRPTAVAHTEVTVDGAREASTSTRG